MSKRTLMFTISQIICLLPVFAIADVDFLSWQNLLLIVALGIYGGLNFREGATDESR